MSSSLSAFSQCNIREKLLKKVEQSNPTDQKNILGVIKAKTKEEFEINDVRNHVGNLFHGRASETTGFFKNIHASIDKQDNSISEIRNCFDKINGGKAENISSSIKKYCKFISENAKNKPNEIRSQSVDFFTKILAQIPDNKKEKADLYFKEMIVSSAHFINDVGMPADERKNYINTYLESVESMVNLLFEDDIPDLSTEEKQIFKDTLLVTMTYSGMLLTYQKKGFVNKFLIAVKRAFIPIAYLLSAVSGTAVGHFVTAGTLKAAIGLAGLAGTICPWILIAIGGFAAGLALTYLLEKSIEKIFEVAEHRINNESDANAKNILTNEFELAQTNKEGICIQGIGEVKTPKRSDVRNMVFKGKSFSNNGVEIVECTRVIAGENIITNINEKVTKVQEKISLHENSVNGISRRTLNIFTSKDKELFKNLQSEIKSLFILLATPDVEDLWNELLYLLHNFINCSENKSEKMLKQDYNRIINIFKQVVPKGLEKGAESVIMEALLKVVFQPRPFSTASLRNCFLFVFWFTDFSNDQLGIIATVMTSQVVSGGTTLAASLGAEFGANVAVGLLPLGLGVILNLSLKACSMMKDKHEVHVPNLQIREAVAAHLEKEKERCENGLKLWDNFQQFNLSQQDKSFEFVDLDEKSEVKFTGSSNDVLNFLHGKSLQYARQFLMFKVEFFENDRYTIHFEFKDSLSLVPEGYFTYPLTTVRKSMLKDYLKKINTQLQYSNVAKVTMSNPNTDSDASSRAPSPLTSPAPSPPSPTPEILIA
ncbi:MAG: hypothetical protein V4591_01315 [Bdellovibrionota bacterium]